jgi:hypothetical protein
VLIIGLDVGMLRQLELEDMDAAAVIHRAAFDRALPALAGRHTPEEDRWFFRARVFPACRIWGCFDDAGMAGFIAFREDWIDQLYVCRRRKGVDGAPSFCMWRSVRLPGSIFGRSSAMPPRGVIMRHEVLCS